MANQNIISEDKIEEVVKRIVENISLQKIILFGSYIKDNFNEHRKLINLL